MKVPFEKWHGCQNDFILFRAYANQQPIADSMVRQASDLCRRDGTGIGADGVLILRGEDADSVPSRLTIINSDGSLANTCGNGIRCAAASCQRQTRENLDFLDLELEKGKSHCRFLKELGDECFVAIEMGVPVVNRQELLQQAEKEVVRVNKVCELKINEVAVCEIGNQHIVLTVDEHQTSSEAEFGKAMQESSYWDGINIHFVISQQPDQKDQSQASNILNATLGEVFDTYVWERGAGPTKACGSGACAIVSTAMATGFSERGEWYGVQMPGGRLYVKQTDEDEPILLAGPAVKAFQGEVDL